jgi:predicted ester cyclase
MDCDLVTAAVTYLRQRVVVLSARAQPVSTCATWSSGRRRLISPADGRRKNGVDVSGHDKEVVRRWIEEVWTTGNAALIDDLMAEDMVDHNPIPGLPAGREARKQILGMFHAAFEVKMHLDLLLEDGGYVIDRWTATLTHIGEFMGIPATGMTAQLTGIDISRLAGGKIAETWHQEDVAGLMQQLSQPPA